MDVVEQMVVVVLMQMRRLLEMVVMDIITLEKLAVAVEEKVDNSVKTQIMVVTLKLVAVAVEETVQQSEEIQDLVLL